MKITMRFILIIAAISGFAAVLIGSMGSHFLTQYMSERGPEMFRTATLYHLIHTLALLGTGLIFPLAQKSAQKSTQKSAKALIFLKISAVSFMVGILLFSGLMYFLALSPGFSLFLLIPLGGFAFMLGWIMLGLSAFSLKAE